MAGKGVLANNTDKIRKEERAKSSARTVLPVGSKASHTRITSPGEGKALAGWNNAVPGSDSISQISSPAIPGGRYFLYISLLIIRQVSEDF